MKKILFVTVFALSFAIAFSIPSRAAETDTEDIFEYVISQSEDGYILSRVSQTAQEILSEGTLDALILLCDNGKIRFDSITPNANLEFPEGEFTLCGSITTVYSVKVGSGTSLNLDGAKITLAGDASLELSGELGISSSEITSASASAVKLVSPTAKLILNSGEISAASDEAAVSIQYGTAALLGGTVKNSRSVALSNNSHITLANEVCVSGVGFDATSTAPITLGAEGVSYNPTQPLKLQYMSEFEKGSAIPVCYPADSVSMSAVRVFDVVGREYPLTYFNFLEGVSDVPFFAVYLPLTVKYYCAGTLVGTQKVLVSELITPPSPDEKSGYIFDGWYLDEKTEEPLPNDFSVTADTKLYGRYKLIPPTFSISSFSAEYSGRRMDITFDTLSHPLDTLGGRYEVQWYKDGLYVSQGSILSVSQTSDSGVYSCRITYHYGADSVSIYAEGINVTVLKQIVPIPKIEPKIYNGKSQSPTLPISSLYTASDTQGKDVGIYTVTLTLNDTENYRFESGEGVVNIGFEILKADNEWTEEISAFDIYSGAEIDVAAKSLFGTPTYIFSKTQDGEYTALAPDAPGVYFVRAYVAGEKNYNELLSEPRKFTVIEERAAYMVLVSPPEICEYSAFELLSLKGISVKVVYNSGREEIVSEGRLAVSYQQGDSFRYGDTAALVSFMGASAAVSVTVKRAAYDLSEIKFPDVKRIYNADYQSVIYSGERIIGKDGLPLEITVSGGGVSVGEHLITLSFMTDSQNYMIPEPITAKLTILPYTAEISWQNTNFVYDGNLKCPIASYVDARGVLRYPKVSGGATLAGDQYVAFTESSDANYTFISGSITYSIAKADYDLSGAFWIGDGFVYDGTVKSVSLSGLPEGVIVTGYTDARATESGKYTATASLSFDERNYNAPKAPTYTWEIAPAKYDMSGVEFTGYTATFDGMTHYPTLSGELPVGADGIRVEYSFSRGATHVSDGAVSVFITFTTASKNYIPPDPMSATVKIEPRGIYVLWSGDSFIYTGELLSPSASAPECKIAVSEGKRDAGKYTARAISQSSDYFVINDSFSYTILKADNGWLTLPFAETVYESQSLLIGGTAKSGEAAIYFYTDAECKNACERPVLPGVYYAVAVAEETENYLSIKSSPMRFEIIKVVPISMSVKLNKEIFVAYSSLDDDDISAYLLNNDGTKLPLSLSDLQIIYEDSGALLVRHKEISFRHGGFSVILPVNVLRANYDTSDVIWQNTVFTYDGEPKRPTLFGLPEGVSVIGYTTLDATKAGTYTTEAILSYDTENYNPPIISPCSFEIKKCIVNIPSIPTAEYDGKPHAPATSSPLYSFLCDGAYTAAGRYSFRARLSDSENYVFEDGGSECALIFEITPRKIIISVSDTDVYLWEKVPEANYVLSAGSVIAGDDLGLVQYESDGKIYLRSENPNYSLETSPGRINNISRPSPRTTAKIIIGIIIVIAFALFVFIVYLERERIADAIAITRHRIRNHRKSRLKANSKVQEEKNTGTQFFRHDIFGEDEKNGISDETAALTDLSEDIGKVIDINESFDTESCTENRVKDTAADFCYDEDGEYNDDVFSYDGLTDERDKADGIPYEKLTDADEERSEYSITHDSDTHTHPIDSERADELVSDSLAKDLIKKGGEVVYTNGDARSIVNVDTLSQSFEPGDRVDVNILKERSLVPYDTAYLKVLARGAIDKPLSVYANDFSLSAVKMIALTGGEAVRVVTLKNKERKNKSSKNL